MSRICEVCGKKPVAGRTYARRGLAKSKGGVGRKVTGITKRQFRPNIQRVRVVDQKGTVRRARVCAKCLKTGLRKGTITKAVRKPRPPKELAAPAKAPGPAAQAVTEAGESAEAAVESAAGQGDAANGPAPEDQGSAPDDVVDEGHDGLPGGDGTPGE